jgi:16S rRNA (cytidine1402-2'-O)-methyltransferase
MAALFVVATPIGNLDDLSPRALRVLQDADFIACEDTRRTLKLLSHFGIQKALTSYHEFNELERAEELGSRIAAGATIALVSDAGTPAISDPGYRLVRYCRENGFPVIAIPGPNAAITALSVSGLPSDQFLFVGFLPPKTNARRTRLETLRDVDVTIIFYEAPHRIKAMLADLYEIFGNREACVARELTKVHEESRFGKLGELQVDPIEIGEFVVVVAGAAQATEAEKPKWTRESVLKTLGISRNELYDLFFKKGNEG